MKPLLLKDLRENLKIALIGLAIFTLLLVDCYYGSLAHLEALVSNDRGNAVVLPQPLLGDLAGIMTLFCALFGVGLGFLQNRNEAHRDLWAFLVHRPLSRTRIFWAKTMAGLALYSLGAGLPLAIFVVFVRLPGKVAAPFEWGMVWPLFCLFLTGLAYYFAGALTGLRHARWYLSRSFGLGMAWLASSAVLDPACRFPLLGVILPTVVLATAVWGSYQTGGAYRGQPVAGKGALALAMATSSFFILFIFTRGIIYLASGGSAPQSYTYTNYEMFGDGTVVKTTYRNGQAVETADTDGHPLIAIKTNKPFDQNEFYGKRAEDRFKLSNMPEPREGRRLARNAYDYFRAWNFANKTVWYLDRHGKLTGYDSHTRKCIGTLSAPDGEPFLWQGGQSYIYNPEDHQTQLFFFTKKAVYQVDFLAHTVTPVFTPENEEAISGFSGEVSGDFNEAWLVSTHNQVYLLDTAGKVIFKIPYDPDYVKYPDVQLWDLDRTNAAIPHFAVWFTTHANRYVASNSRRPIQVVWLSPDLGVIKKASLPPLPQSHLTPSTADKIAGKLALALVPPVVAVVSVWTFFGGGYLTNFPLAVICAGVVWWLARRYQFPLTARIGWALFMLLTGLPGLLGFLCVQEWPAREVCPDCQKRRVVDREFCEHCGAPFPPPEKNGTEIFAPLEKALA